MKPTGISCMIDVTPFIYKIKKQPNGMASRSTPRVASPEGAERSIGGCGGFSLSISVLEMGRVARRRPPRRSPQGIGGRAGWGQLPPPSGGRSGGDPLLPLPAPVISGESLLGCFIQSKCEVDRHTGSFCLLFCHRQLRNSLHLP